MLPDEEMSDVFSHELVHATVQQLLVDRLHHGVHHQYCRNKAEYKGLNCADATEPFVARLSGEWAP